jgi:membrane-associated protease RseP (regulator of RpoE activity)
MPFVIAALATVPFVAAIPPGNHTFFSIAIAILGIGFLIFVHELGHFLACRLTGTRVETFSIGFGPRLFGWERLGRSGRRTFTVGPRKIRADQDGFDWRISAIPLGGYVKMAGEVGGDGTPTEGLGIVRPPSPDEFPQKPFPARAFIISAGVIMNAIAAVTLYSIAYGSGLEETPPIAGAVTPGGAAWAAGIRAGDRFETYDGEPVRSFEEFANEVVFTRRGSPVEVVLDRRGAKVPVALSPKYEAEMGLQRAGVEHPFEWTIDDGKSPKLVIGPNEPVRVSGRFAGGAASALRLARIAQALGVESVRIELPSRSGAPARDVALPLPKPDWKTEGPPMLGVALHDRTLTVESVFPGGAAEKAGIRKKDRLVAIDGVTLEGDRMLRWVRRLGRIDVERDGAPVALTPAIEDPEVVTAVLDDLVFEKADGVLVTPDGGSFPDGKSPAAEAGVRPWDQILEVGGTKIAKSEDVLAALKAQPAGKVSVKVKSSGQEPRVVEVLPKPRVDPTGHEGPFGDGAR